MNMFHHKWLGWTVGSAMALGLVAYPLATRTARADVNVHAPVLLDHNPRIHKALDALREARKELDEAPHDFHGKKHDAMDAVDKAIERLDEIKDYEN